MDKITAPELTSYAGGAVSIGASLTLTQWGVAAGIVTALLTFALNALYVYRKDRREQRESDARMARLMGGDHACDIA